MPRPRGRFGKSFYQKLNDTEKTFYKGYLDGTNKVTIARKPAATELKRYACGVIPFGVSTQAAPAENNVLVTATAQAIKIAKAFSTNLSLFAITDNPGAAVQGKEGFYPALCRLSVKPTTSTVTNEKSQFTGRDYKYKAGRSGSVPFGRGVTGRIDKNTKTAETTEADVDYEDARNTIETEIRKATPTGLVLGSMSFVPEYWELTTQPATGNASTVSGTVSF